MNSDLEVEAEETLSSPACFLFRCSNRSPKTIGVLIMRGLWKHPHSYIQKGFEGVLLWFNLITLTSWTLTCILTPALTSAVHSDLLRLHVCPEAQESTRVEERDQRVFPSHAPLLIRQTGQQATMPAFHTDTQTLRSLRLARGHPHLRCLSWPCCPSAEWALPLVNFMVLPSVLLFST